MMPTNLLCHPLSFFERQDVHRTGVKSGPIFFEEKQDLIYTELGKNY